MFDIRGLVGCLLVLGAALGIVGWLLFSWLVSHFQISVRWV